MKNEKLLTVREAAIMLDVSERAVMDLVDEGKLSAYKIGGVYLRFKKDQLDSYKESTGGLSREKQKEKLGPFKDRAADFFYFNDFYIVSAIVIAVIIFIIIRGY